MTKERLTIMIDPELRAQLQDMADRDARSLSDMLRVCAMVGMKIVKERLDAAEKVLDLR